MAETGSVYHRDSQCSYLKLSIRTTSKGEVGELRNHDGEKYKSCERCMGGKEDAVGLYITETGNKYHSSLDCSGLKRHIDAVPITEVGGMLTVIDIKTKRVPRIFLGIAIGSVCILCLFGGAEEIIRSVLGAIIGLMFVVFSYITKEAIGYGDSWLMVWLGI